MNLLINHNIHDETPIYFKPQVAHIVLSPEPMLKSLSSIYLLPGDPRHRSANSSRHENNWFSFLHVRRGETFHELGRDHLFLLDDVKVALERCFASFVPRDTGHDPGVRAAHVGDHQGVVA